METLSFFDWLTQSYVESPVATTLLGLLALASGVALIRKALKIAAALIVLAMLAILASWVLRGNDATEESIDKVGERVIETSEELLDGHDTKLR